MEQTAELFEPGEYLESRGPGWFTLAAKPLGAGSWTEQHYPLTALPIIVNGVDITKDTYITQAVFKTGNRRAVNVQSVGLIFVDLDTYRVPNLTTRRPEEQAVLLAGFCTANDVPIPSIVVFSGRGLQAKWLLTEALDPVEIHVWNQAQIALVHLLEPFASDTAAKDISRVLRLTHTMNTKSGERCRVVFTSSGTADCLARYDFEELSKKILQKVVKPDPSTKPSGRIIQGLGDFTFKRLAWARLYDIRDLWTARGGVPVGYREITLFWELVHLLRAEPGRSQDIWKEAQALASQIDPASGWYHQSDLSTLYRKAKQSLVGTLVTFQGRQYPPLYTPKNETLAEIFRITPDEERSLRTIISSTEKYRRRVEKRRADGVKDQMQSLTKTRPWEAMGISRRTWYSRRGQEI